MTVKDSNPNKAYLKHLETKANQRCSSNIQVSRKILPLGFILLRKPDPLTSAGESCCSFLIFLIFLTDQSHHVILSMYNSACISTGQGVKTRQIAITLNNQNLLQAMAIRQASHVNHSVLLPKGARWCKRCSNHFNSSTVSSSVPNNLPRWQRFRTKRKRLRARKARKKSCHVLCACMIMYACARNKLYYALLKALVYQSYM